MTLEDVIAVCEDYGYRKTGPNSDLLQWLRGSLKESEENAASVDELRQEASGERVRADSYKEDW